MERERLDPVDLMILGRLDEAAKIYLDTYIEMVIEEGDAYIGPHLLSQLHLCVAGKEFGRIPEDSTGEVEQMVMHALYKRGLVDKKYIVKQDIQIAREYVVADRKEAEKELRRWV